METVITRVQRVLQKEFSPREIRFSHVGKGKYSGWIISKSFDKLNDDERYQRVWNLVKANLTEKDRSHILGFFLFTPLEERMIFDENFDVLTPSKLKNSSSSKKKTAAARKNGRAIAKRR